MKLLKEKLILEEPEDEIEVEEKEEVEIPEAELEQPIQVNDIPEEVVDNAYGNLISNSISREWDDINSYKDLVAQFVSEQKYPEVVDILNQLIDDKTISIGMLTKALELINGTEQNDLMQQGIDKANEVIGDDANKEGVVEESLEEANANYVWKKCGDDWCLVVKGKEPKEDGNNLVELSRMNKYFPWTIYVKGKEKKNLDLPSDNINDIKKYIIDNIDKILGKKLKEAKVDYVKKDTYGKYGTEVTIYSCEGDETTKKGFTATVNGKSLEADTLEELEKQIIDAVNSEDKKADNTILNDSLNEEDSKKRELPKGKMITNGKGISYYKQGNKYYSNTGWLEREISKEEFDREVEKAFKELDEDELDEDLDDYTNRWTKLARKSSMNDNKIDYEELYNDDEKQYKYIESKLVEDSDGFVTDYTMYFDNINNKYVFVFGDYDLYTPEDGDFDYECETAQEAREWFDNYKGFEDDDLDESMAKMFYSKPDKPNPNKKIKIKYGNSPKEAESNACISIKYSQLQGYKDNYSYVRVINESLKENIITYGYIIKSNLTNRTIAQKDGFKNKEDALSEAENEKKKLMNKYPGSNCKIDVFEDYNFSDKSLKEDNGKTFYIVDLVSGDKFGNYTSIDQAKGKAKYYATEFRTKVAVIDNNNKVVCGYTSLGKEIQPKDKYESLKEGHITNEYKGYELDWNDDLLDIENGKADLTVKIIKDGKEVASANGFKSAREWVDKNFKEPYLILNKFDVDAEYLDDIQKEDVKFMPYGKVTQSQWEEFLSKAKSPYWLTWDELVEENGEPPYTESLKESPKYKDLVKVNDDTWKYKDKVTIGYNSKGKYYFVIEPENLNWMYSEKLNDLILSIDRELNESLKEARDYESEYNITSADKKKIIQWWKDIDNYYKNTGSKSYVSGIDEIDNTDDIDGWLDTMWDALLDLVDEKKDSLEALQLLRRGKLLYNKYVPYSKFNYGVKENKK